MEYLNKQQLYPQNHRLYKQASSIVAYLAQHNRKLCPEMRETNWQVYVIKDDTWNAFTSGVSDLS